MTATKSGSNSGSGSGSSHHPSGGVAAEAATVVATAAVTEQPAAFVMLDYAFNSAVLKDYLKDIRTTGTSLDLKINSETLITNQKNTY